MSQLLQRLNSELDVAVDPHVRAELLARKVCVLARLSRFDEASELVKVLRSTYGDWSNGRTHVWIMIAEALIHWYSAFSPYALDRVIRAQVLSVAMRYDTVIAISSAWKAHIEFEMSDFAGMFASLKLAINATSEENNDAKVRIAIILCIAYTVCGDWNGFQTWFKKGRDFALANGDQASVEALQYNRAALTINWIRAEHFEGMSSTDAVRAVRREFESAKNLHAITRNDVFGNHIPLCEARLCIIEERYDNAIASFDLTRGQAPFASHNYSDHLINLEVSYCHFKLGRYDEALSGLLSIDYAELVDLDIDDRLAAICMLHEMYINDSRFGVVEEIASKRLELRSAYINSMEVLRTGLSALDVGRLLN